MKFLLLVVLTFRLWATPCQAQVSYHNCLNTVQLPAVAKRIVTLDINSTELALALGLQNSIVGVAGIEDRRSILPEFQSAAKNLVSLSSSYPSLRQLQKAQPELIIGGWKNGFSRGTPVEPGPLLSHGMGSYILRETCAHEADHVPQKVTFAQTLFMDLHELGRLTGTEARAQSLIQSMQGRLQKVEADVLVHARPESVRVLVYDGGATEVLTVGQEALLSEVIRLAGGRNIFADRHGTWQYVSWSDVVRADPELILVVDYGAGDAIFKVQDLEQNPALQNVTAVRDKHYFILPYAAAIPGIRSVGITELLADHLICTFHSLSQGAKTCLDVPSAF